MTNLCSPLQMRPSAKAVLMCLADRADDAGLCWPSIPRIGKWTCLRRTAVIEAIKWLKAEKFVEVDREKGVHNVFQINIQRLEDLQPTDDDDGDTSPFTGLPPGRQTDYHQSATRTGSCAEPVRLPDPTSPAPGLPPVRLPDEPVRLPDPIHQETPIRHQETSQAELAAPDFVLTSPDDAAAKLPQLFDAFWKAYPKRVAKDDAIKAFAKRKVDAALLAEMIAAIKAQGLAEKCAGSDKRFVPYPATWLNEGRWKDEIDDRHFIGSSEGRTGNGVAL